ncbi:hypothetical protein E4K10_05195 [Streptomyces sp. T1317-0309]|nr:hypothetical protein E4K10_05195 [Streptomyces sp. T1317-0309]
MLKQRRNLILLANRERQGTALSPTDQTRLASLRSDPQIRRRRADDERRKQVTPTLLGNAIRRFEEYGYNHFGLDSQVLWDELIGVVPDAVRRQTETARTSVDFFVALLYGHLLVERRRSARCALLPGRRPCCSSPVWDSRSWHLSGMVRMPSADDWAAAVRALVNLGRKPLAESLGLVLPEKLADEREMWTKVTRFALRPYGVDSDGLDAYRAKPPGA